MVHELFTRTTHSSEVGRLTSETFTDAWAQRAALDTGDDLGEWLRSVATKEAVSSLRSPKATTTGRETPKNLRIVVDEASIDAVARELLDTDPTSLPKPPASAWSRIEQRLHPPEVSTHPQEEPKAPRSAGGSRHAMRVAPVTALPLRRVSTLSPRSCAQRIGAGRRSP